MSTSFDSDFSSEFAQLTPDEQAQVMRFLRGIKRDLPKGTPGVELLRFAGSIPHEDIEAMKTAIEEGCEQVDPDGW